MTTIVSTRERLDELLSYLNGQKMWLLRSDELALAIVDVGNQLQQLSQEHPELEAAADSCYLAVQSLKDGARASAVVEQLGEALATVNETV